MSTVTIYIENKPYTVKEGQNLLQACLSLGFNVPYFCWHPAMHSVGACRQCAVKEFKDEKDTRGRVIMSCMTGVRDGMRISIEDAEAKSFRRNIIELLMLNHPHDCPVCDEGSECHLQDMTVMTGHVYRRSRFSKRTYRNQELGPFLTHEMNRCIQCYRCVRYYRDYAGGRDLNVFAIHDHVYFGRQKDGALESEFSGNLAEICPTGVFTDKTFQKHYSRKWDLQTAPSVCVHCGVGCNTLPGERYGELRRIRCRYHGEVNRYFLCDRGRFGYEFVNSAKRIRGIFVNKDEDRATLNQGKKDFFAHAKSAFSGSKGIIGIGSPRASLESNFALRCLVGPENFFSGMSVREHALVALAIDVLRNGPARSPSLREVESCDAVLILGEDVTNTAPLLALSIRQAARQKALQAARNLRLPLWDDAAVRNATQDVPSTLSVATLSESRLDDAACRSLRAAPDNIARIGFAVARALNSDLPAVTGLSESDRSFVADVAKDLKNAKRPLIVSGTGCGSEAVIGAAANIAWSLSGRDTTPCLSLVVPECNSLGLGLMNAGTLDKAFESVRKGSADIAVILENDLYRRAGTEEVDSFLGAIRHTIVIDSVETPTALKAGTILPAAAFAEADGTFVSAEGRAQRFCQVFMPHGEMQESWRWVRDLMQADGRGNTEWEGLDNVIAALAEAMPVFSSLPRLSPPAGFRITGMKIPRQPHRFSGRTAMSADKTVFEPRPSRDRDSPLAFSMEGYRGQPPSSLITGFWSPGWNSPQAITRFQSEVNGPLKGGDPGIRLIEPSPSGTVSYYGKIPPAFVPQQDMLFLVPAYHIYGSEEMSMLSPAIAERSETPYVGLSAATMAEHDLRESDEVLLTVNSVHFALKGKQVAGLSDYLALLPAGLPNAAILPLFSWARISKRATNSGVTP